MKKLRVLDLFSGIGGFSLGLERAGGFETVAFCEIEEFPRKVLKKHWPEVPIHRDIRKLSGADIGTVDVICGGYPCQPFSTAGRRRGAEDDRHLWPEFNRLVDELRPAWVIGENVAGHISMGLDSVLSDLEGQGYTARAFVIPACAVDAPHRRDRVWIVANSSGRRQRGPGAGESEQPRRAKAIGPSEVMADAQKLQRNGSAQHSKQGQRQISESGKRSCAHAMADADSKRGCGGNSGGKHAENAWQPPANSRRDASGVGSWHPEPRVGRVAYGVPGRVDRLKALGNTVVPQIPEMIGRAILDAGGI